MRINDKGLALIKSFEGRRLKAYRCPAGVPTIGYGHTEGVEMGQTITEAQAEELLRRDLEEFEQGVSKAIGKAPTTPDQFSAMVSFAFNLGLASLNRSSVLRYHRLGEYGTAADSFRLWVLAKGRRLEGLVRRREAEAELYRGSP